MKVIIGLGNPGKEYENTRHNVGFMCIDMLAKKYNTNINENKLKSLVGTTNINGKKIIFAKPQTYMNLSGEAVVAIKNFYKLEDKDILIIYDDIDINTGTIRYRKSGSAGTHNGMRNIIDILKNEEIPRIRVGTGPIENKNIKLVDYVLQRFSNEDLEKIATQMNSILEKFEEFIDNNDN